MATRARQKFVILQQVTHLLTPLSLSTIYKAQVRIQLSTSLDECSCNNTQETQHHPGQISTLDWHPIYYRRTMASVYTIYTMYCTKSPRLLQQYFLSLTSTTWKDKGGSCMGTPPCVEDFDISTGVLKNFRNKRVTAIPKHFIASKWCYVLPSMKKGQIVSISHEIPPHCPFQSYREFQKHWKNMTVQTRPPNLTTKPFFRTALTQVPTVKYAISKSSSIYPIGGSQKTRVIDNEQKIDLKTGLEPGSVSTAIICGSTFRATDKPGVVFLNSSQSEKSQVSTLATPHQMEVHSTSYNHRSSAYKIIPIFKSKLLQQDKQFISARINESKTKQCVKFNSRKLLTLSSSTANIEVTKPNDMRGKESRSEKEMGLSKIAHKQTSIANTRVEKPSANTLHHKSSTSVGLMKPGARAVQTFGKNQEQSSTNIQMEGKNAVGITISDGSCTKWNDNLTGNHQHKQKLDMFDIKEPLKQDKQMPTQHLNVKSLTGRHFSDKKGAEKRKCEEKGSDSNPKKPKAKPVIQDVDVAKHAKNNQLSKLNSVTLQSWLKCRGISVKKRDKKEQLVSKIMEFIKGPTE
ncbi:uncharacterized protein C18orf63-like [Heterodontus francisci]|uniref:uncharacterized protein C18orf63-like n=1 Tax=Heterodontus francisci TaxID=7792 RepID=UPI00355AF907